MVALALVLGGTAVAASTATPLTKASGTKLIKKLAPTLSVKHAKTANVAVGAYVAASPAALASGATEYGTIGSQPPAAGIGSGNEIGDNASLPFPAPVALDNNHVQVAGSDGTGVQCPGTAAAPSAAPGYVCIYPYATSNASNFAGYVWGGNTSKYGFQLSWHSTSGGYSYMFANWAYRAP
jgi:hypothetical protein